MSGGFRDYVARAAKGAAPSIIDALASPVTVTFFRDQYASSKREWTGSLRELVPLLRDTRAASKAALPWLKLATFGDNRTAKGAYRHDGNLISISGIEADYDGEAITLDRAESIIRQAGLAAILYTSPSHTPDMPRWRILCPLSMPHAPDTREGLLSRVNGLFVGALSRESFTLSQSYYYGAVDGTEHHQVVEIPGRYLDQATELDATAHGIPTRPRPTDPAPSAPSAKGYQHETTDGTHYGLAALDSECDAIRYAPDGGKHDALNKAAYSIGGLVSAGEIQQAPAYNALAGALSDIRHRCKDYGAALRTLQQAFREGMAATRVVPERVEPPPEQHPAAPLLAKLAAVLHKREAATPMPIAPGLMDVPGLLGDFVAHCTKSAISPQPFLALAAGITMVGTLAGRKYRTSTDLRTNIYAVGIADSGAGKDHARKQIKKLLFAAGLERYMGGSDVASGSGLRTALTRHPAMLFQIDEFGDWLADVLGDKASAHRKQIASMLKELYSSANLPWQGIEYADQSRAGRPREDIQHPHACLYGTTTPGQFWAAVANASLHDGLMARVLIFVSPCSYPDEQEPDLAPFPESMIEAAKAIAEGAGAIAGPAGNLAAAPMMSGTEPKPYTVPETTEAAAARRAMRAAQLAQQRAAEGTYITSIAGRLAENAMKLALVRAVSRDPKNPIINISDVQWGQALTQHCIDSLLREVAHNVASTQYERIEKKILGIIRAHGPLTEHAMAARHSLGLPPRERKEALADLVATGRIVAIPPDAGQRGPKTYKYAIACDAAE